MTYFLWPTPHATLRTVLTFSSAHFSDVERRMGELYCDTIPVLFPSGRSALSAIVEASGLTRAEHLWTMPFLSHCVLDAVSRVTTPTASWDPQRTAHALVYHQWGFVHRAPENVEVIEDSADTLCPPGPIEFPNGGRFQLFSLPKIFGCVAGGLVLCRERQDAERLIEIRRNRPLSGLLQWALRLAGARLPAAERYWLGVEASNGSLPSMACADILAAASRLPDLIADRKIKLAMLEPFITPGVTLHATRLPTAVPIDYSVAAADLLQAWGVTTGVRHFNTTQRVDSAIWKKVLPVPVHQGIPVALLTRLTETLRVKR